MNLLKFFSDIIMGLFIGVLVLISITLIIVGVFTAFGLVGIPIFAFGIGMLYLCQYLIKKYFKININLF